MAAQGLATNALDLSGVDVSPAHEREFFADQRTGWVPAAAWTKRSQRVEVTPGASGEIPRETLGDLLHGDQRSGPGRSPAACAGPGLPADPTTEGMWPLRRRIAGESRQRCQNRPA